MSREWIISGIDPQTFKKNLKDICVTYPRLVEINFDEFTAESISKVDELLFEYYSDMEPRRKLLQIEELISYGSKQICFSIRQLVHYYNDYFSWEENADPRFEILDDSFLLSKEKSLDLIEWLSCVSSELNEFEDLAKEYCKFRKEAMGLIHGGGCTTEEFTYFGDMAYIFQDWKEIIERSEFEYYLWEDSY